MKNKKIIIANWKIDLDIKESKRLSVQVLKYLKKSNKKRKLAKIDIVLCPGFTSLSAISKIFKSKVFKKVILGAQDCFWEDKGDFTGEISPIRLKQLGCKYVILGHSERRQNLAETDDMVHKKIKTALKSGLIPIICIGETLDERRRGLKDYVILNQASKALAGISLKPKQKIVVAYEPVWVIGSGRAITPEEAEYMNKVIYQRMIDLFPLSIVQNNIRVIYGGSVDSSNVKSFVDLQTINGVLVGSASLKAKEFVKMCEAIC